MNKMIGAIIQNASKASLQNILRNIDEQVVAAAIAKEMGIAVQIAKPEPTTDEVATMADMKLIYEFTDCHLSFTETRRFMREVRQILLSVPTHNRSLKVEAVKYVRNVTNCGLKTGLDFVNHLMSNIFVPSI